MDKYGWVDIGSSFLPSEITAAFLYAQIEHLDRIQSRRKQLWNLYYAGLKELENKGILKLPHIPEGASNNAHLFYILCNSLNDRTDLINHLKKNGILAVFHYISLHSSPFYATKHDGRKLLWSDYYTDHLLRLPMFYELKNDELSFIIEKIIGFYNN